MVKIRPGTGWLEDPSVRLALARGGAVAAEVVRRVTDSLALEVDGKIVWEDTFAGGTAEGLKQVALPPDAQRARLLMYDTPGQAEPHVLADQAIALAAGQILPFRFSDAHMGGDPEAGRKLFLKGASGVNTGCSICHSLQPGVRLVGPTLAGVGTGAATRVPGMPAEPPPNPQ